MLSTELVTAAYIGSSVLFILSLGGLSNQEKAKRGVWFGNCIRAGNECF